MKRIDTTGKRCPAPLILTKRGLQEAASGETLEIVTDNQTACSNLISYLAEMGITPEIREEGEISILTIIKADTIADPVEVTSCPSSSVHDYVVVIKSTTMGDGDPELGRILMRAFVNSLKDADRLPSSILLYNEGVRVALNGSDTADTLRELEDRGVAILVCGTCVDFYDVKDRLAVGMISNMYKITKLLGEAGHVVYP